MIGLMNLLGCKTLLLIGSIEMTVCLLGVAEIFHSGLHQNRLVWLLVGFIFFFATSQGPAIWVYLSEIFPTRVRSKGQRLGSTTHWVMAAIITFNFESIANGIATVPFVVFAGAMALQFFVILAFSRRQRCITGRSPAQVEDRLESPSDVIDWKQMIEARNV